MHVNNPLRLSKYGAILGKFFRMRGGIPPTVEACRAGRAGRMLHGRAAQFTHAAAGGAGVEL